MGSAGVSAYWSYIYQPITNITTMRPSLKGMGVFFLFLTIISSAFSQQSAVIPPTTITTAGDQVTAIQGSFQVSGVYPHLTTYTHFRTDGRQTYRLRGERLFPQLECGIGALAVWQDKLYMVNYAAHEPNGSEHKLYIIDKDLNMQVFQGSVGGTPAARMIHQESSQLFIGHYAIDQQGNIRTISIKDMPGRMTAIARHLSDPENKVYYYDMEGMLYEVDVHTLKPALLFRNPLPGWHGKGAYTAQGRLVMANNGENHGAMEPTNFWQVDTAGVYGKENNGILAEYDGNKFTIVERRQYTDVTTRHGIRAVPNDQAPLWSMGWDKRSVRLKVLDKGQWHTYLLPKATCNNDPSHGWFTEWPRIREINDGKFMMDMHGMFYDFPADFSSTHARGIRPMGSHLRYIPDFTYWNGKIVLATDETSIQGNPLAGQAQSNLWFGHAAELEKWGPASAYGAIWLEDSVNANVPSLPFLFNGFDQRVIHLVNHSVMPTRVTLEINRNGNAAWENYRELTLAPGGYSFLMFDRGMRAEWIRLKSSANARLTASLHYTDADLPAEEAGKTLFEGIAAASYTGKVHHARLYSNHDNLNLTVFSGEVTEGKFKPGPVFELNKFSFEIEKGIRDSTARKSLHNEVIWSADEASVVLQAKQYRLRLPFGRGNYAPAAMRNVREVESERVLANIHGTFYELPLYEVGAEPLYKMMRPVATHNRQITDFNTWNGLLVLSGIRADAKASTHILKYDDGALWIGAIDDLWKFGKPVGEGGVWLNTAVKAGELSDMYLMTGFDRKTIRLTADKDVRISIWLHMAHYSDKPVLYKTFSIKAGQPLTHVFPEGFSAHWLQMAADKDCRATGWVIYD